MAIGLFSLILAPTVFGQSVLDDIKARLESEGIAVIDYSTAEGAWGSLPSDWIAFLSFKGYIGLKPIADLLKPDYINKGGLTELRRELALIEAKKTTLTIDLEINDIDDEIQLLKDEIKKKTDDIKNGIRDDIIGDAGASTEDGVNLIFHEVDFYFNYSKWGSLPTRVIGILESEYTSLQDLIDEQAAAEADPEILFSNLDSILSDIEIVIGDGKIIKLSQDDIQLIIDSMAILNASGERQLNEITRAVANTIKNLIAGLAVIWIIYAGARMVFAQGDESTITEQKRAILYAVIGLVSILLVGRGIEFLYGPAGIVRTELVQDTGFTNEVYGIVNFIKALIGTIAILFIVISGVRTLFAAGEEDVTTKQKKSLLWIGVGLILIAIDKIIIEQFFIIPSQEQSDQIRTSNITTIINTIGSVIQFLLGFVGLIAFGALIYGAATMIMNYGNDEMVQNSKKIITNAIIGILVILSAYVIVSTLVIFR